MTLHVGYLYPPTPLVQGRCIFHLPEGDSLWEACCMSRFAFPLSSSSSFTISAGLTARWLPGTFGVTRGEKALRVPKEASAPGHQPLRTRGWSFSP